MSFSDMFFNVFPTDNNSIKSKKIIDRLLAAKNNRRLELDNSQVFNIKKLCVEKKKTTNFFFLFGLISTVRPLRPWVPQRLTRKQQHMTGL